MTACPGLQTYIANGKKTGRFGLCLFPQLIRNVIYYIIQLITQVVIILTKLQKENMTVTKTLHLKKKKILSVFINTRLFILRLAWRSSSPRFEQASTFAAAPAERVCAPR